MTKANPRLADRAWLLRRYRRDQADVLTIATEAAAAPSTVWRALGRHGIALRGAAGRRSLVHVPDAAVHEAVSTAETLTDAAGWLGVDLATLVERLARMGLHSWPGGAEDADQLAAEYLAGASVASLAASHGCSTRTVRRRLAAAGVAMRPRGRPAS